MQHPIRSGGKLSPRGIRRAGKSFLLYQYIQELLEQGHSIEEILFINFEVERISDIKKLDFGML